jgi:uncharacterized protein (TIGR02246 family)
MLFGIVRVGAFTSALAGLLVFTGCADSSDRTDGTSNTQISNANSNNEAEKMKGDIQQISTLLDQYNDALLKKDADTLGQIWADDLSFVNLRGQLLSKKERIENIKTGATELKSAQVAEKNVRIYGNTAVATLRVNIQGQYSGQEGSGSFRITTVWAKPRGTWQMVAVQMTPIAK